MFKRIWWVFLVMLPVGAIGGMGVMAVVSYVMPKQYESQATIEVRPSASLPDGVKPRPVGCGVEFDKIKSRASLVKIVDKLELTHKWGVDQEVAIRILKKIVSTENIRGTDLISIRVRHTDRDGGRDIAAEVARIYRDYRVEIMDRDQDYVMAELDKAVREQEDKVEERRKVLVIATRTGSFLAGPEMTEAEVKKSMDELRSQDLIEAKRNLETDQALLQNIKLKQGSETIAKQVHDESVVIHQEPQIGETPVSPNVTLNLVLGAVGGFLLSPLLSLLVVALFHRLAPRQEGGISAQAG